VNTDQQIEQINEQLTARWVKIVQARERGDWEAYWKLRRSWLSLGRLQSFLVQEQVEERDAQLTLLPPAAGRLHDRDNAT